MKKIIYILMIIAVGLFIIGCGGGSDSGSGPRPDSVRVSMSQSSLVLVADEVFQLNATVLPDTIDKTVAWTTSNSAVAAVDQTGKVTGKSKGSATITVTTAVGGKTATCSVKVTSVKMLKDKSKYEYDIKSLTLKVAPTDNFNAVLEEETYKTKTANSSGFITAFIQNTEDGSIYFAELNENGSKYDIVKPYYVAFPSNPYVGYTQNYNNITYGDFTGLGVEIKGTKTFNVSGKNYTAYEVKYTWTLDEDVFEETWWWSKEIGWYIANEDCVLISFS